MAESSHPEVICHSCGFKWQVLGDPPSNCPLCKATSFMEAPNPLEMPQILYRVEAKNDPYRERHLVMEGEHEIDRRQYREAKSEPKRRGFDSTGRFWGIVFFGIVIAVIGWITYLNVTKPEI